MSAVLKTPVSINWNGQGGTVVISYTGLDKLDVILQRLTTVGAVV